jgi:hypothetical protein
METTFEGSRGQTFGGCGVHFRVSTHCTLRGGGGGGGHVAGHLSNGNHEGVGGGGSRGGMWDEGSRKGGKVGPEGGTWGIGPLMMHTHDKRPMPRWPAKEYSSLTGGGDGGQ